MIKITFLYPNEEGGRFDMDYYLTVHMPLSIEKQGRALKGVQVETGLCGTEQGYTPPFVAICHFLYESMNDFLNAFLPHADVLQGDTINYTNIESIIQLSQVHIDR